MIIEYTMQRRADLDVEWCKGFEVMSFKVWLKNTYGACIVDVTHHCNIEFENDSDLTAFKLKFGV